MLNDADLLRQYATNGSEEAFTELVSRHLSLVYSAALRQVHGDAHLAEDVAQMVFIDLAQKAQGLVRHPVLSGWLYVSTRMAAANALRAQARREKREQTAWAMQPSTSEASSATDWVRLSAALDAAMAKLNGGDRDAVLLRYFERKELKAVGATLGISEDAARMRVNRALEKLRSVLSERGIALSATALTTLITGEALSAVPTGLIAKIASVALLNAGTMSGAGIGALKVLSMTKAQLGILGLVLATAVITPLWVQHRMQNQLEEENRALRQELNLLRQTNENLTLAKVDTAELDRLRREEAELLRLRGELNVLRRQPKATIPEQGPSSSGTDTNSAPIPVTKLQASISAQIGRGQTLIMGGWPGATGHRVLMLATPKVGGENADQIEIATKLIEVPESLLATAGLDGFRVDGTESSLQQVVPTDNASAMLKVFEQSDESSLVAQFKLTTKDGQQAQMTQADKQVIDGQTWELGPTINIMPKIADQMGTVEVRFDTEITRPNSAKR
jgi:RNA polymerase sigma factor (sigma-70 family)